MCACVWHVAENSLQCSDTTWVSGIQTQVLIANSLYPLSHVYPIKVLFVSVLV